MLTHKQVAAINHTWQRRLGGISGDWIVPELVKARNTTDAGKQGIHLLNPDSRELEDAYESAGQNGFRRIYIHNKRTFGKSKL